MNRKICSTAIALLAAFTLVGCQQKSSSGLSQYADTSSKEKTLTSKCLDAMLNGKASAADDYFIKYAPDDSLGIIRTAEEAAKAKTAAAMEYYKEMAKLIVSKYAIKTNQASFVVDSIARTSVSVTVTGIDYHKVQLSAAKINRKTAKQIKALIAKNQKLPLQKKSYSVEIQSKNGKNLKIRGITNA